MADCGVMLRSFRAYWAASALLLAMLAGIGFYAVWRHATIVLSRDFLVFDAPHNGIHAVLAVLALGLSFAPARIARPSAQALGVAYLALAALGFVSGRLFGLTDFTGLHLEIAENVLHLGLGAWGVLVGTTPISAHR